MDDRVTLAEKRNHMVARHIVARGVRDPSVLQALRRVPRERFVPAHLRDHAYDDGPLTVAQDVVLPAPYVFAYMAEALTLERDDKVLVWGAGAGYGAAVLGRIVRNIHVIEPKAEVAEKAAAAIIDAGLSNVHMLHDDDLRAWQEEAPFDAILIEMAVAEVPEALKSQLALGGRLVAVVGTDPHAQELVRITRREKGQFDREDLADLRYVPPVDDPGAATRAARLDIAAAPRMIQTRPRTDDALPGLIVRHAERFDTVDDADLDPLMDRIGDARVVLLGEATHGTAEFYRMRARITQRLIRDKGFGIVAIEADWPDAARIDDYVRHVDVEPAAWQAFSRFPTWMWRNEETRAFIDWLHRHNATRAPARRTGFYGLDLYSLYTSTQAILEYLDGVDLELAALARQRYACLTPWQADPAAYGRAALTGAYASCAEDVTRMLVALYKKRHDLSRRDGARFLDAAQNATLVANAEQYYRIMYYGSRASWNLRDSHMFETLQNVMLFHGPASRAVVWAHNSHVGDARATEMSRRGEHNLGELCTRGFGGDCYRVGFGTDHGTVAAASDWDGPMRAMQVRPAHPQSYERQFHLTRLPGLILPMRAGQELDVATALSYPRLERAIGVIYRPESELASHYFEADLPQQFDDYVWIDKTRAVTPLSTATLEGLPDTYPFGV